MASSSSLTVFHSAFLSTRNLSPSLEFLQILKPWQRKLAPKTKVPAILTLEKRIARVRVRVNAGYTKRPMETAGAYELIDDESGERVIVWGGVDDDESSLPSKRAVSWNPENHEEETTRIEENFGGTETPSAVQRNSVATSRTQKLSRGFGRLKVQKIRSLVRKVSQEKQETDEHKYEELAIDELDDDDDGQRATLASKCVFIKGSRNVTVKSGIEQLIDGQLHVKSSETNTVPGVSASHPKGWRAREPKQSSRGELRDLKHVQKFSAGSDFFSRKFFKADRKSVV